MDRNFHGSERIWGEMHKYIELESSLEVEERGKLPKGYNKKVMSDQNSLFIYHGCTSKKNKKRSILNLLEK